MNVVPLLPLIRTPILSAAAAAFGVLIPNEAIIYQSPAPTVILPVGNVAYVVVPPSVVVKSDAANTSSSNNSNIVKRASRIVAVPVSVFHCIANVSADGEAGAVHTFTSATDITSTTFSGSILYACNVTAVTDVFCNLTRTSLVFELFCTVADQKIA